MASGVYPAAAVLASELGVPETAANIPDDGFRGSL